MCLALRELLYRMHNYKIKNNTLYISLTGKCQSKTNYIDKKTTHLDLKYSLCLRPALFWVVTQRVVVISYRRVRKTYRSHFYGSLPLKKGPDVLPKRR